MAKSKLDADKELLFSKLLPALNQNPFVHPQDSRVQADSLDAQPVSLPETGEFSAEDSLSALRSKLFGRSETGEADSYAAVNLMENLVLQNLDSALRRFNVCTCDRCRCDAAAYALNRLPPRYQTAEPGEKAQLPDEADSKLVTDALVTAVIKVRGNPRH